MHSTPSLASLLDAWRTQSPTQRATWLATLSPDEATSLTYAWRLWARPEQLSPPGSWSTWVVLAGRGWGKTRVGCEFIRQEVTAGRMGRVAIVGRTAADVRDVLVEGESGLLAIHPKRERPVWVASRRRLRWPNGAIATTYSAEEPDQLRGPQHDGALADEVAAWQHPEAYDQLRFGLRIGHHPRVVVTTTPRPTAIIRNLIDDPLSVVTRGRTADNRANLSPGVVAELERRYGGTRLGRQELDGEVLTDTPGALWTYGSFEGARGRVDKAPDLRRVVVAIDPAVTSSEVSDETGIVVVGVGYDDRGYVLADHSGRYTATQWASLAVGLYRKHHADRIVAEVNNGGDLVEAALRTVDRSVSFRAVHASRGKAIRAEPVAALYEQGRVSHVGVLKELEDQMVTWSPISDKASPDRLDALVWGLTNLMVSDKPPRTAGEAYSDD